MYKRRKIFLLLILLITGTLPITSQNNKVKSARLLNTTSGSVKLFLCGDVMTGRGIDQALPFPVPPVLYESWVKNARIYLRLAEQKNGRIETPLAWDYIWGDALKVWEKELPDLKLINLETSITSFPEPWPGKGINYRMNPKNINLLTAAGIGHCSLANNHTLDWGRPGLEETLQTLKEANIRYSGAGMNLSEAVKPSVFQMDKGRVLVFSYATGSSGVPGPWLVTPGLPGVNYLPETGEKEILQIQQTIKEIKQSGDVVVFSIHWGGNWGYAIPSIHREFACRLLDEAGVDLIYGHSSHHPLGLEVHNNKLIIYGAGDFINDYEGISGHEEFRGELTLMFFPVIMFKTGELKSLKMIPMEIKNFRLNRAKAKDATWLFNTLNRECKKLSTKLMLESDNSLWLEW